MAKIAGAILAGRISYPFSTYISFGSFQREKTIIKNLWALVMEFIPSTIKENLPLTKI